MTGSAPAAIIPFCKRAGSDEQGIRQGGSSKLTYVDRYRADRRALRSPGGGLRQGLPLLSEHVNLECECGQRLNFTAVSAATCTRCGANHAATIREEITAERLEDQTLHPWRYDTRDLEDASLPY